MLKTNQTVITAAALDVLYTDQTVQENSIGSDRVSYFLNLANNTAEQEFRDAVRDFKNAHKQDDKVPAVVNVRASEFSALYYANLNNIILADMGYHAAIKKAREQLTAKGLRTNGKPILSDEDKQANREKNLRRKAFKEAEKLIDMGQPDAIKKLAEEAEKQLSVIQTQMETEALAKKFEKVTKLVDSIMADGDVYAMEVMLQLAKRLDVEIELDFTGEQSE